MANTDLQKERSERIYKVFNELNANTMDILDNFYDENLVFIDPVGKLKGLEAMKAYYANMYQNVQEIRFDFTNEVVNGDTHVVIWVMYLKAEGLKGGDEVVLEGNSHIVFSEASNKVIFHRDYFDMGAFIYEHIPILGTIIKKIRQRFEH